MILVKVFDLKAFVAGKLKKMYIYFKTKNIETKNYILSCNNNEEYNKEGKYFLELKFHDYYKRITIVILAHTNPKLMYDNNI